MTDVPEPDDSDITPHLEPDTDSSVLWPNQTKVKAGIVPQSKVSQDPALYADLPEEELSTEMGV